LALIGGLGVALKYISLRGITLPGTAIRARRLQIVESLAIDTRRRFVIVRCDGHEHLLLLNPTRDIVVEANLPSSPATQNQVS
jgi:flagellar protein FliO/FliZ